MAVFQLTVFAVEKLCSLKRFS